MTAAPADLAPEPIQPAFLGGRRLGPAEGWTSVALVALMAATLGLSLDDPRYVLGVGEWTDFLPWVAVLGALAGTFGAFVYVTLFLLQVHDPQYVGDLHRLLDRFLEHVALR